MISRGVSAALLTSHYTDSVMLLRPGSVGGGKEVGAHNETKRRSDGCYIRGLEVFRTSSHFRKGQF